MTSFEDLFNASTLEVLVPQASFILPAKGPDDCLEQMRKSEDRKTAFFDEKLQFLLLMRIARPNPEEDEDPEHPPAYLLSFLSHLQVSYEATYIPSAPAASPGTPTAMRLSAPPRTLSLKNLKPKSNALHPSIFPPHTPNPTPLTTDKDRKYTQAEGQLLSAGIWGEDSSPESPETFALLWSASEQAWTAVYKLVVTVSFLRMNISDPLLCLTVSTTLRDKPLPVTKARQPLADLIAAIGHVSSGEATASTEATGGADGTQDDEDPDLIGLEEVNLLDGLATGPTFPREGFDKLYLPSTRLGTTVRKESFSLPSLSPKSPTLSSPGPKLAQPPPTLRKSFRKTLATVSGFHVRMRSVFVPYVLLPEVIIAQADEDEDEKERREAGTEERTVVLCVEVQNSGESGMGFAIESVDVSISGEGATARFIGWGDKQGEKQFPLLVNSMEQFNLLYAVSFWQADDAGAIEGELQRAVVINIHGRPFEAPSEPEEEPIPDELVYPAQTFASRWNCVVDLSPSRAGTELTQNIDPATFTQLDALPAPASPFPNVPTPRTSSLLSPQEKTATIQQQQLQTVAGSKRHTLAVITPGLRTNTSLGPHGKSKLTPVNYRSSTSMLNPANHRDSLPVQHPRSAFLPPSLVLQQSAPRTPTTFSPRMTSPPLPPPPLSPDSTDSTAGQFANMPVVPPTPAYPAYPSSPLPPTPYSQGPMGGGMPVAPSVDIRRERGLGMMGQLPPQTPGPRLIGAGFADRGMMAVAQLQNLQDTRVKEPIVVSIGLGPLEKDRRMVPLDRFVLDIFVFNQSSWIRRFEVSYPERSRRRRENRRSREYFPPVEETQRGKADKGPGITPLENRIRVGPLRPSTCQSVRMEFLALAPGVHTIDTLVLTDVESGKTMNLRSVMDIVVHDPSDV